MIARRILRCRNESLAYWISTSRRRSFGSSTVQGESSSLTPLSDTKKYQVPVVVLFSLATGFILGRQSVPPPKDEGHDHDHQHNHRHLPDGMPRTCCNETELPEDHRKLFHTLKRIVGKNNVLSGREETAQTLPFLKGARLGKGNALFIVQPQRLKDVVEVVQAVIDANCVVLVQGANTGLTGGSVPRQQADGRPTVLVSMRQLDMIIPIDNGERVLCLAGVGLASLNNFVQEHFHRESHSILGSTFLNPTTAAGISLGSGGTQMRKGPAYTERALYLKVLPDKFGKATVKVVNTMGIQDLDCEEGEFDAHIRHDGIIRIMDKYITSLQADHTHQMKRSNDTYGMKPASDKEYRKRLCDDDDEVNRYNADTRGADCNRSEGKVIILASVHDTFAKPTSTKTFWLSFDSLDTALQFRKEVCLDNPVDVPISMEYMDRDSFDVINQAGLILGNIIYAVGTSSPIVKNFWNLKLWIESLNVRGASTIGDKLLYWFNPIMPSILPSTIMAMGKERDHHVAMTVGDFDGSLDRFMQRMVQFKEKHPNSIAIHECQSQSEMDALTAFRFVAAPAFRTYCVGNDIQGFSVDYALPKSGGTVPPLQLATPVKRMRYSHFGCNVVHEDVAFPNGIDVDAIKYALKKSVEHECHGRLPAEHGHGCEYKAPPETQQRWMQMDPMNVMNPGVGGLPSTYRYRTDN